jgi:hypothetical protein
MKRISVLITIIVIVANLPPAKWLAGPDDIAYSNENGTFTFDEVNSSGRDYKLCIENFQAFKATHSNDTLLFRITAINILAFWRWGNYLSEKKYKLRYKSWKEIEALRGPVVNKTNWQAF